MNHFIYICLIIIAYMMGKNIAYGKVLEAQELRERLALSKDKDASIKLGSQWYCPRHNQGGNFGEGCSVCKGEG